jgi:hypothetical protein
MYGNVLVDIGEELARACRTVLTLYMTFLTEFMHAMDLQEEAIEEGYDPDPVNWHEIWSKMNTTWPDIIWLSFREWCVEGIRITYARSVHQNCSRRIVWKLLKGAPQFLNSGTYMHVLYALWVCK